MTNFLFDMDEIQPTARAFQLFGSIRQALQLVQNDCRDGVLKPTGSEHCVSSFACAVRWTISWRHRFIIV